MPVDSIFLFGQFSPGDLGASYRHAFNALGLRTHTLDLNEHRHHFGWWTRTRIPHRLTIRSGLIRSKSLQAFNRLLEDAVVRSGAPAMLSLSLATLLPETVDNLRRRGIRVACFFPDNPFPPHYGSRPETLPVAREADLCLIWSESLVEKLRAAGVRNPAFLPFAWDSQVFPYQGAQDQGTWPGVLFVGNWDRQREAFLEKLASHVPVRIYGTGYWGTRSMPFSRVRRCWQRTVLRSTEAARAIRESAICLNVLRRQHIVDGEPDGLIMRHFEVPGAGGFLLSTRSGGATTLFPEGETAEYFSDLPECVEKVVRYLANDSARREIVARAHAAVAAHHQYTDRARQILQLLDEIAATPQVSHR
jgi:hypothetical protein